MSTTSSGSPWPWKQLTTLTNLKSLTTKLPSSFNASSLTSSSTSSLSLSPASSSSSSFLLKTATATASAASSAIPSKLTTNPIQINDITATSSYDTYDDYNEYIDYNNLFSNLTESSSSISLSSSLIASSSATASLLSPSSSSSSPSLSSSSSSATATHPAILSPSIQSAASSLISTLYNNDNENDSNSISNSTNNNSLDIISINSGNSDYNYNTTQFDNLNATTTSLQQYLINDTIMKINYDEFAELWNCTTCLFLNYDNSNAISSGSMTSNYTTFNISDNLNLTDSGNIDKETTVYIIEILVTSIILGLVILATVIGNVFVIAAILLERNLQSVANHLILSLAVADLLVACLVMPFGAVYEVSKEWTLGPELCDMWTSSDVLCCTASILHLVAIALDRYWAVTDIDYAHQRTSKRIGIMIFVIWLLSFLVSIAPLLGWKDPEWNDRIVKDMECIVSQDIGYQIFATASSFYVPLLVILFLYWRIFLTARKRIRKRQQGKSIVQLIPKPFAIQTHPNASCMALTAGFQWKVTGPQQHTSNSSGMIATAAASSGGMAGIVAVIGRPLPTISETTTAFTNVSSTNTSPEKGSLGNGVDRKGGDIEADQPTMDNISMAYPSSTSANPTKSSNPRKKTQNSADSKRERKAAKTLAIITGAFVCCWLPFFILAILLPICTEQCNISKLTMSICLWLGYFNSTLNPIIYTIFSPEFRHAFKRILCGRKNGLRRARNLRHFR